MAVTCPECNKEFTNNSNYKRHHKEKHEEIKEDGKYLCFLCGKLFKRGEGLKVHIQSVHSLGDKVECSICKFTTVRKSNLLRHIKMVHEGEKAKYRRKTTKPDKVQVCLPFQCSLCPRQFSHKSNLSYHERKKHTSVGTIALSHKKICPLCSFSTEIASYKGREVMYDHFENEHSIPMKWETHQFNNLSDFYAWKYEIESNTASKFIKSRRGDRSDINNNCVTFICHRSGIYKSKGSGKRWKRMVSCKINGYCPALITTKVGNNGKVKVSYESVHVGHKNELSNLYLTESERTTMTVKLAAKVPVEEILEEIRGSLTDCELQKIYLTTRKEIQNIEKSFNLDNDAARQPFNPVNVEMWVSEYRGLEENSFLFFKPVGAIDENIPDLKSEDFLLIFMTDAQKEILRKYGADVVFIDGTSGANTFYPPVQTSSIQLFVILVLDDTREAIPIAFMFSSRQDEDILKVFFEKIKEYVGEIKSQVFISDMDVIFYNAWRKVMGETGMQYYCMWHILKAWRMNINQKIKLKINRDEVYKSLQIILCELDENIFHMKIKVALEKWNENNDTKEFSSFFLSTYIEKDVYKNWACCYRTYGNINTNVSIENFNKLLKYCYLRRNNAKRLDKTLCSVLKILRENLFKILVNMHKATVVSKLQNLRKYHKESFKLDTCNIVAQSEGWWQVFSTDNQSCTVRKIRSHVCDACAIQCHHCKSCFHQYICSCIDNGLKNNMCKHIHVIARLVRDQETAPTRDDVEDDVHEIGLGESDIILDIPQVSEVSEVGVEYTVLNVTEVNNDREDDFETAKEKFIQDISQMLSENITNYQELRTIQDHCKPIKLFLDSMKAVSKPL